MNIGAPWPDLAEAEHRVLVMQTKLHQWAKVDPGRRFDDLANLVYDPAFLVVAWSRVRGNKGARTAGVDGVAPRSIVFGAAGLLGGLRDDLKADRFVPQRVREKTIPKASGKVRSLGIPTVADRVVQSSLKLVLEPIFEADFKPGSYGFRPKRRAQDAIAEIHYLGSPTRNYLWVFEADIKACFDEIDHTALMGRVRDRIGDKRVLGWVKAFLNAGVLTEEGRNRETITGTPQGGILSPLLANIALSVLDEHFAAKWAALGPAWTRAKRRRAGEPVMRLVRYADDFVVMVHGTRDDAEALWGEVAAVLAPMGLRLSEEKTRVCHLDEGFDFLGWHIQRRAWRGRAGKRAVYTYPSKKSLLSVMDKVRSLTRRARHRTLADLLRRLNPTLRGWCNYFRHGVSSRTFNYVDHFAFWRIVGWLKKRHVGLNMHTLVRRYLPGWRISDGGIEMFRPYKVNIERYRYRGAQIPTPWSSATTTGSPAPAA
ncbi:MAG: group II intron reverse transcriptase/maturase [Candidatus Microthrix sp.]|uniref:group II intron reverse transcriptase/maturase n=1 Tax=Candidatus Neomicrothrix sp. TaxID=2719034 RepID=UPI001B4266C3|nr:group II intron reverse transcriptase/maturase [Candidatus Microthrix sp.]MBP7988777.1 group II intron reverse transcriptase/maturase [Candidatus Microthrix sp.]MBP7996186.1 group II intron reverse transcriptase/maturase [Candidatus Microthrix sp.]MBP9066459.1 group II intron reverse transcriptase/maturase [Candidatus Microthrix sp.]MCI1263143.1 group II intron reverse transcriptase/maturase [Tetrasphaera jenkinsii]